MFSIHTQAQVENLIISKYFLFLFLVDKSFVHKIVIVYTNNICIIFLCNKYESEKVINLTFNRIFLTLDVHKNKF